MSPDSPKASPVGSVDRALRIIEILSHHGRGMTLDELALSAELPHSSMHRLLGALKHRGSPPSPNRTAGTSWAPRFWLRPSGSTTGSTYPRWCIRCWPRFTRSTTKRSTWASCRTSRSSIWTRSRRSGRSNSRRSSADGTRRTAPGWARRCWPGPIPATTRLAGWLRRNGRLEQRTPTTLVTPEALAAELEQCRRQGFALDLGENEQGVNCAAVPLFLGGKKPAAAISLSAPANRMPEEELHRVAAFLRKLEADSFLTGQDEDATAAPER